MNIKRFNGVDVFVVVALIGFVIAIVSIPPRVKEPAAHTVPYKSEQCTKHNVTDVNGKNHLLLMCPSSNYILSSEEGKP